MEKTSPNQTEEAITSTAKKSNVDSTTEPSKDTNQKKLKDSASSEDEEEDYDDHYWGHDPRMDLWELLQEVEAPGSFATSGFCDSQMSSPGLVVDGIGAIDLPLSPSTAKSLLSRCDQAPFGQGEKTIVNTSVRNTKQLDLKNFQITNSLWDEHLKSVISKVKRDLGVENYIRVKAQLYKLLCYEPGSFFKPHRDSEKVKGMFGSLIIILPSSYTGGDLVVHHAGDTKTFDQSKEAPLQTQYATFYADCKHELKEVQTGHRLCLVYNLVKVGKKGQKPSAKLTSSKTLPLLKQIKAISQAWTKQWDGKKLVIMMEHMYTQVGMEESSDGSSENFKGKDAAITQILDQALDAGSGITWDAATVTLDEEGYADGWEDHEYFNYDECEWIETLDSTVELNTRSHGCVPVSLEDEIVPSDYFENKEPDSEYFAPTGNEGVQAERQYIDHAIVVWPGAHYGLKGLK